MNQKTMLRRCGLAAAAAGVLALAPAGVAAADPCALDDPAVTPAALSLFDSGGYEFDFTGADGRLKDGGSHGPSQMPSGPIRNRDAWDLWGTLVVGTAPYQAGDVYAPGDDGACTRSADGRQLAFPVAELGGLKVSRTASVLAGGRRGLRMVTTLANAGAAPVTTDVLVGEVTSQAFGGLGSDSGTVVAATSSGDRTIDPTDAWAVTADQDDASLNAEPDGRGYDPVLSHVMDGAGGADHVDVAQLGGAAVDDPSHELEPDMLGWGWQGVTIAPGETASYVSYEVQSDAPRADNPSIGDRAAALAGALDVAPAWAGAAPADVYAGMSREQILSVRNWPHPRPTLAIAPPGQGTNTADVVLSSAGTDLSRGTACGDGQLTWDLGDGQSASGAEVAHRYLPGEYTVRLSGANGCGESGSASANLTVVAAPAKLAVAAPKAVRLAALRKKGLRALVRSDQAGTLTMSGSVAVKDARALKLPRRLLTGARAVAAGVRVPLKLRLRAQAAKAVKRALARRARGRRAHSGVTFTLTTTVKTAYGKVSTTRRTVTIRR